MVLDAQDSLMVLSVKHRTHAPGTRHTDPDLQALLSGTSIAACRRARSYKAICNIACSRVAFELQAECADHNLQCQDQRITCLTLLAADRQRLRGDVPFAVLEWAYGMVSEWSRVRGFSPFWLGRELLHFSSRIDSTFSRSFCRCLDSASTAASAKLCSCWRCSISC